MKYRAVLDITEMDWQDADEVRDILTGLDLVMGNNTFFEFSMDEFEHSGLEGFDKLGLIFAKYVEGNDNFILLYWW